MAKTNKSGKNANMKRGTITLDFTEAYAKNEQYLNTPCAGTMEIPVKTSRWQKIKNWFKKK